MTNNDKQQKVIIYGDIDVNSDELELLRNKPDFAMFTKIDKDQIKIEFEIGLTKVRWNRRTTGYKEDDLETESMSKEELDRYKAMDEKTEMEMRTVFDMENCKLDMGNRRPTDCKANRRVIIPPPRPGKEEAELMLRKEGWTEVVNKYYKDYCNSEGKQSVGNLSKAEKSGLTSLMQRVAKEEIVVLQSDKCKQLCIASMEKYIEMGSEHIGADKQVNWKEIKETQANLNGSSRAFFNIFNVGSNGSEQASKRVCSNITSSSWVVPTLRITPKLHKKNKDNGMPHTRPLVGASNCMSSRCSEIVADVLDVLIEAGTDFESNSTEDTLNKVENAEKIIEQKGKNVINASADVVALFPSIPIEEAAKDIYQLVIESEVEMTNINYQAAAKYIATLCTEEEIRKAGLSKIVPRRRHKRGSKPGLTNPEIFKRLKAKADKYIENTDKEEDNSVWTNIPADSTISKTDKRKLLAKALEIGIIQIMKNHLYQFNGITYKQTKGGGYRPKINRDYS